MHKKYNSFYLGYVVQNNDPDKGGKVKIFVPAIMPTLGGISTEINANNADVQIDFSDLSRVSPTVLAQMKNALPWARQVSPLIGSGSPTIFNARDHTTSSVDDPIWRKWHTDLKKLGAKLDEPRRPGVIRRIIQFIFKGAFGSKTTKDPDFGPIPITPTASPTNNFSSSIKSNMAKGAFSIPSVGAVVWMFFENGEWDLPVYFGYQHATTAWKEIFDGTGGYPSGLENNPGTGGGAAGGDTTIEGVPIDEKVPLPEGGGAPPDGSKLWPDDPNFVGPPRPGEEPRPYNGGNTPPQTTPAMPPATPNDNVPGSGVVNPTDSFGNPRPAFNVPAQGRPQQFFDPARSTAPAQVDPDFRPGDPG